MALRISTSTPFPHRTTGLPPITSFTIMAWVFMSASRATWSNCFYYGNGISVYYTFMCGSDGRTPYLYNGVTSSLVGPQLPLTTWAHVALSVAGTGTNQTKGYVNGALRAQLNGNASVVSNDLIVGNGYSSEWFNGRFANILVYDVALSESEIAQQMAQYLPVRTAGLNSWTPFLYHDAVTDASGQGRAFVIDGGPGTTEDGPPIPWMLQRPRRVWHLGTVGVSLTATDDVPLGESLTLTGLTLPLPLLQDALSVTESTTLVLPFVPCAIGDGLTVSDLVTLRLPVLPVTLTESLTLGDATPVLLAVEGLWQIGRQDDVSVTDTATVQSGAVQVAVTEALTVGEQSPVVAPVVPVTLTESLTLGDPVTLRLPVLSLLVADALALDDVTPVLRGMEGVWLVLSLDTVSVGDSVTVQPGALIASVIDPLTLDDSVTVPSSALTASVTDALALDDLVTVPSSALIVSVTDPLPLTDSPLVAGVWQFLSVIDGLMVGEQSTLYAVDQPNAGYVFMNAMSLVVPSSFHKSGTPNLLIQVYDAGTPARQVTPGSVAVHLTLYDVTVTFGQPQSGRVVIGGAPATTLARGNVAAMFTQQTSVTLPGAVHGLRTPNLLVHVYDDATPMAEVLPETLTVHPTSYDITVTFGQPQSGRFVVSGYSVSGVRPNVSQGFTQQTSVTMLGATHAFQTMNLLAQVYDAAAVPAQVQPETLTIDPTSYDVTVTFGQPQSGRLVVSGSQQVLTIQVVDECLLDEQVLHFLPMLNGVSSELLVVGDPVTLRLPVLPLLVVDPLTLGDPVTLRFPVLRLMVVDVLTLDDPATVQSRTLKGAVTEALTLSELVTVLTPVVLLTATDPLTVDDPVTLRVPVLRLGVVDALILDESTSVLLGIEGVWQLAVVESLSLADLVTVQSSALKVSITEAMTVGETRQLTRTMFASVTEGLSVGETRQLTSTAAFSVTEDLTLDEACQLTSTGAVRITDGLSVEEILQLTGTSTVHITEGLSVGETRQFTGTRAVSVTEHLSVGESVALKSSALVLAAQDDLTLGEEGSHRLPVVRMQQAEVVSLGEALDIALPFLALAVTSPVQVADSAAPLMPVLGLSVEDALVLSEAPATSLRQAVVVQDGVALEDRVAVALILAPAINEGLAVGEALAFVSDVTDATVEILMVVDTPRVHVVHVAKAVTVRRLGLIRGATFVKT